MSHRLATSATRASAAIRTASSSPSIVANGYTSVAAASRRPSIVGTASAIVASTDHHANASHCLLSQHPISFTPIIADATSIAQRKYATSSSSSRLINPTIRRCAVRLASTSSSLSYNSSLFRRRSISSSSLLLDNDSQQPPATTATDEGDECPNWQNPLHHNNPAFSKVFAEDFAPGEEMPVVPLPPFETPENEGKVLASPELHALADEIVRLSMIEVKELVDRVGEHFGLVDEDEDDYGGGGGGGVDSGGAAKEEVVEKTVFDLKLTGFDEKSKIKVIKEIRSITALGLKEAKELVEGAPTTVKKNIKKEEAEELKLKLEAVGGTIEIV